FIALLRPTTVFRMTEGTSYQHSLFCQAPVASLFPRNHSADFAIPPIRVFGRKSKNARAGDSIPSALAVLPGASPYSGAYRCVSSASCNDAWLPKSLQNKSSTTRRLAIMLESLFSPKDRGACTSCDASTGE